MALDTRLTLLQIFTVQCLFYMAQGLILGIFHVIFSCSVTLDRFFTDKYLDLASSEGVVELLILILSSVVGAFILLLVVEKPKLAFDFSATLYLFHLIACIAYNGLPQSILWWGVLVSCCFITGGLGEYLCVRAEALNLSYRLRFLA